LLVIVANKDPTDLESLRSGLAASDMQVLSATDGDVVVNLAARRGPDAVVVGASLGEMGGFAVSRELKTMAELGEIREPKVIVILERDADSWLAKWARCDAYRTNPVDVAEIDQLVRELVATRV
jgi:DNA-binding response OmpR family regulator